LSASHTFLCKFWTFRILLSRSNFTQTAPNIGIELKNVILFKIQNTYLIRIILRKLAPGTLNMKAGKKIGFPVVYNCGTVGHIAMILLFEVTGYSII